MNLRLTRFDTAFFGALALLISGCGGGGGSDAGAPSATPAATTNVSTTVVDGAIKNALVCLDKNGNGQCDSGEAQGRTDAAGNVTLAVPNGDVGKYPIVALVGTDAVDADNGPVGIAYALSAPADQTGVVSPLTTLVQQTVATTGSSTTEAAKAVQQATGLTASMFQDFTKAAAPTDGTVNAATVARMLVVAAQRQAAVIAGTVGTRAIDGTTIAQPDLDKAIQKKLLELLPALVTALSDPAVLAATTPAAKEAALLAAATTLVNDAGLSAAAVPTVVAIHAQTAASAPTTVTAPAAGAGLHTLSFTNPLNHFFRVLTASIAQNTPDASNNVRYVERRVRTAAGSVAKWGAGGEPSRGADLHWNGGAWVNCPINFENVASVRDAAGNSLYNHCDGRESGKSNRASFDVTGKTMAEVYAQARAAGYTNFSIVDPTVLGSTAFPAGSSLLYQASTSLSNAIGYQPSGAGNPAGFGNIVTQYSAAVAAGGTASAQAAGTACNATETGGNGSNSTTLEALIASRPGTPCAYTQGSIVYNGTTYLSEPANEWWGNSTVGIGKVGSVALNTGTTAPGYYSGNTQLRIAFKGTGTNPVTYYACRERFTTGSARNCTAIGTGSYAIQTLGDARVLTLTNPPVQAAPLTYNRVFVERGGAVYFGYQNKPAVTNTARLNLVGGNALLGRLGMMPEDPAAPLALTAASYQGTWDVSRDGNLATGITMFIGGTGTTSCQKKTDALFFACTMTITNPATGALAYSDANSTASGTASFLAGTASGTYHDTITLPSDGVMTAGRR